MKVAIYCRMARDESNEIKRQEEMLKNFAKEKGFEVVKIISETGSGNDVTREGLKEIMEIATAKEVNMILTRDFSRISRDFIHSHEFVDKLKKHVDFRTMDNFDVKDEETATLKAINKMVFEEMRKTKKTRLPLTI